MSERTEVTLLSKKKTSDKALSYAYRLLGIRPRSEKELKERLFGKRYGSEAIESVISQLKEKGVVDDLKFARAWVESRMRTSPKGNVALKRELGMKGISNPITEEVLSEKKEDEASIVKELAEKKMESLKDLPKEKARKRLFDFLARRGFNFDTIKDAVREHLDVE